MQQLICSRTYSNSSCKCEQILNPKAPPILEIQVLQKPRFALDSISFAKSVQRMCHHQNPGILYAKVSLKSLINVHPGVTVG